MSNRVARVRRIVILVLTLVGMLFTFGALISELFKIGPTPGFGVIETLFLLLGITSLTIAGYLFMAGRRPPDTPRSLQADIGIRLSLTGLVLAYVSGYADLIRIGTHVGPDFNRPYIGPLQLGGLALGIVVILIGMILYYTSRGKRSSSSLEFLLNGNGEKPSL